MKFEIGKSYQTRLATDADTFIGFRVIARTAKTIRVTPVCVGSGIYYNDRYRITERDGIEYVMPWGSFSMAPIVGANGEAK